MNLLVIEDDRKLNRMLCEILEKEGYTVKACTDGEEGAYYLQQNAYDLALVDWMLPGESGPDILRESRRKGIMTPVVMLTALTAVENKVTCLDAGADDYLAKPFGMMELVSRVRALLRRAAKPAAEDKLFTAGSLAVDVKRRAVTVDGEPVILTYKEFELLCYLLENRGVVLSRDQILTKIWDYNYSGETRTVDVHIRTLRQKLGAYGSLIETVRGVGYRLEVQA